MMKEKNIAGKAGKKLVQMMVFIISILVMDFAINIANKLIFSLPLKLSSYEMTALGMGFVVLLALPVISIPNLLERITKWILETTIKISSLIFQKNIAVFLIFITLLFVLYIGFYWVWYNKLLFFESSGQDVIFLEKLKSGTEEIGREFLGIKK